jgi:aryl-alcohol dehydrogenase-like predicted oxidoreductase
MGILAYSPLQRGVLAGKIGMSHEFKEGDNRRNSPYYKMENREKILELLGKLYPIAAGNNMTLSQLVINWTIQRPGIASALVGARNVAQIDENGRSADFRLNEGDIKIIDSYLDELNLDLR